MEILDAIQMNASFNPAYKTIWKYIELYGTDSIEVDNWLVQFEDCQDAVDFMLRYDEQNYF